MTPPERDRRPTSWILRYVSGLRFPWLFGLVGLVFGVDILVPDALPLVDELLLGLVTLLLGAWRKRKDERAATPKREETSGAALPPPAADAPEPNDSETRERS